MDLRVVIVTENGICFFIWLCFMIFLSWNYGTKWARVMYMPSLYVAGVSILLSAINSSYIYFPLGHTPWGLSLFIPLEVLWIGMGVCAVFSQQVILYKILIYKRKTRFTLLLVILISVNVLVALPVFVRLVFLPWVPIVFVYLPFHFYMLMVAGVWILLALRLRNVPKRHRRIVQYKLNIYWGILISIAFSTDVLLLLVGGQNTPLYRNIAKPIYHVLFLVPLVNALVGQYKRSLLPPEPQVNMVMLQDLTPNRQGEGPTNLHP